MDDGLSERCIVEAAALMSVYGRYNEHTEHFVNLCTYLPQTSLQIVKANDALFDFYQGVFNAVPRCSTVERLEGRTALHAARRGRARALTEGADRGARRHPGAAESSAIARDLILGSTPSRGEVTVRTVLQGLLTCQPCRGDPQEPTADPAPQVRGEERGAVGGWQARDLSADEPEAFRLTAQDGGSSTRTASRSTRATPPAMRPGASSTQQATTGLPSP